MYHQDVYCHMHTPNSHQIPRSSSCELCETKEIVDYTNPSAALNLEAQWTNALFVVAFDPPHCSSCAACASLSPRWLLRRFHECYTRNSIFGNLTSPFRPTKPSSSNISTRLRFSLASSSEFKAVTIASECEWCAAANVPFVPSLCVCSKRH